MIAVGEGYFGVLQVTLRTVEAYIVVSFVRWSLVYRIRTWFTCNEPEGVVGAALEDGTGKTASIRYILQKK